MSKQLFPPNEDKRLAALRKLSILDTPAEQIFDDLTNLAAFVCGTPVSLISLIDDERQWFKSRYNWQAEFTERSISFCQYTILFDEVFEVEDARGDEILKNNPLVKGDPGIAFYAGTQVTDSQGFALGTICVIDFKPNKLTDEQKKYLKIIGRQVSYLFSLRKLVKSTGNSLSESFTSQERNLGYRKMALAEIQNLLNRAAHNQGEFEKLSTLIDDLRLNATLEDHGLQAGTFNFTELEESLSSLAVPLQLKNKIDKGDNWHGPAETFSKTLMLVCNLLELRGAKSLEVLLHYVWEMKGDAKLQARISVAEAEIDKNNNAVYQQLKELLVNKLLAPYNDKLQREAGGGQLTYSFELIFKRA